MPSTFTTRLRLTLPATGELTNTWGTTVNTGITELVDASIAGTATLSTWGGAGVAYTLSNNNGVADEARCMFIVAAGSPGENKNIICPAVSKLYVVKNEVAGGFSVTLKTASGTGITVENGKTAVLRCTGTDVVDAITQLPAFSLAGGTVNGVVYLNASRTLTTSSALTFDGTTLTLSSSPTLSGGTVNTIPYLNASKSLVSGAALGFNGSQMDIGVGVYYGRLNVGRDSSAPYSTLMMGDQATPTNSVGLYMRQTSGASGISTAGADIAFYLGGPGISEAMRLDSSGNLLLGTASTGADGLGISNLLNLTFPEGGGASYTNLFRQASSAATVLANGYKRSATAGGFASSVGTSWAKTAIGLGVGTGAITFYADPAGTVANGTDVTPTERMRLDSSGNVGIGTSSPATKLHVDTGAAGYGITVAANLQTARTYQFGIDVNSCLAIYDTTAAAQRVVLDASGNLGIGTNSPGVRVDASGQVRALESGTGSGNGGLIGSTVSADGNAGILFQTNSVSRWNLTTSGTAGANLRVYNYALASTVATFDSSGNLGLGVTPSAWRSVFSAFDIGRASLAGATGSAQFQLTGNAFQNSAGNWIYRTTDTAVRYEGSNGFHAWFTAPSGTAGNAISFTQAMTLDASGNLALQDGKQYFWGSGRTAIQGTSASDTMQFFTASLERARITAAGDFIHQVNSTAPSLSTNSTMSFELTSNTSLKIVVRGTDGVTRSTTLTLT